MSFASTLVILPNLMVRRQRGKNLTELLLLQWLRLVVNAPKAEVPRLVGSRHDETCAAWVEGQVYNSIFAHLQ